MAKTYLDSLMGEREKILVVARQHWFILARNILLEIVTMAAIVVMVVLGWALLPAFSPIITAAGVLIFLLPLATMLRDILNWVNREFVITSHRVMQISGIFNKAVIDSSLDKVNDVKMVQSALGRMFDYADIEILTASELGVNLFRMIEQPIHFKTAMLNARQSLEGMDVRSFQGAGIAGGAGNIPELIAQLETLRQQGVLTEAEFQTKKAQLLAKL